MKKQDRMKKQKENPNNNIVDLERCCSVSVSVSSSSSSVVVVVNGCDSKWEANGMVKNEIDAARALADFAQLAMLESVAESTRKWGQKRRRSKKRFRNDTASADWGRSNLESSKLKKSVVDLVQRDHSVEAQSWDKKLTENVANTVKVEHEDSELATTTPMYPTNFEPFSGGKSKEQHLTEAEKEARRLRRVLANRESARQTIRRRQVMHEELAKKATHLALDNESMKRKEKVLATKEYQSLKDKNKYLKLEMARNIKYEKEETHKEAPSTMVEAPASSEKLALLGYNGSPFTPIPFIWPPITQPFNPIQAQSIAQNCGASLELAVVSDNSNPSQEQGNLLRTNGPRTPFYIVPYPWFFSIPDHENQPRPHYFPLNIGRIKQDDGFCTTEEHLSNEISKASIELPTNERCRILGARPDGVILMPAAAPAPFPSVKPEKSEDCVQPDSTCKKESLSCTSSYVPENKLESGTDGCTILVDEATSAAEARKRRKELTKLKNYHTRQPRLRC